jgi:RNA polymerase sigma-70 factor (ECF subfamily)
MNIDDKNIFKIYKKNNKKGFNLLYKKFNRHVYSICYRYTNSKEDSLDLTQEVFIKIYKSMDTFNTEKTFKPWISKITVNTCLNYIRSNKTKNNITSIDEEILENKLKASGSTEDSILFYDTKKHLENEISNMPDTIKIVFILRYFNKMSYSDIAKTTALPLGTVKTNLYKGKRLLKNSLINKGVWEV